MNNKYLINLWVLTLVISPALFFGYELFINSFNNLFSILEFFLLILFFSVIFSIPTLILGYFVIKFFNHLNLKNYVEKLIVWSIWLIGTITTLKIINGSLIPKLIFSYTISAFISIIILELKNKTTNIS